MTVNYVNYFEWCGKENKNPYSEKVAREFHEKKKEARCRVCGCTKYYGCINGCWWVEKDLCSNCHDKRK